MLRVNTNLILMFLEKHEPSTYSGTSSYTRTSLIYSFSTGGYGEGNSFFSKKRKGTIYSDRLELEVVCISKSPTVF
jgi:hypothetical protein